MDGGFSEWSAYDECSETCGNGVQTRERKCDNPQPQHGGKDCDGNVIEEKSCMVIKCPGIK